MPKNTGSENRISHPKRLRELPGRMNDQQSSRMTAADAADAQWALVEAIGAQNEIIAALALAMAESLKRIEQSIDNQTTQIELNGAP